MWSLFAGRTGFLLPCAGLRPIMCVVRVTGRLESSYNVRETLRGVHYEQAGVNWRKIKAEYISGRESQRALAEKYGVSRSTLIRRANKEHWTQKRKAADAESEKKVQQKTAEIVADNAVLLERIKTKLLQRLDDMVDTFPTKAQEMKLKDKGIETVYRMRDIAAVYAALEDKTIKTTVDIEDLSPLTELLRDE